MQNNAENNAVKTAVPEMPKEVKLNFDMPDIKEFLAAGSQFGHQVKRWNPKMNKFIYAKRGDIHIIDLAQTIPLLEDALKFLVRAASKGRILMVATKRQAAEIVETEAKRSGAYFVTQRWPGGVLTNFKMIQRSFKKLQRLEEDFENGVEGRTKYEISLMKKDWDRLNRLYRGVKTMDRKPQAIVIVDPNYERNTIREALGTGVPIIAIVDTNCDPDGIQYPIPANDDSVKSVKLIIELLASAIIQGNEGKGVIHEDKDYSKVEVKIVKKLTEAEEEKEKEVAAVDAPEAVEVKIEKTSKSDEASGLLGKSRQKSGGFKVKQAETPEAEEPKKETKKPAKKSETSKKEVTKTAKPKAAKKTEKPVAKKAKAKKPAAKKTTTKKASK